MVLGEDHWRVIDVVRRFHAETGVSPSMRPLVKLARQRAWISAPESPCCGSFRAVRQRGEGRRTADALPGPRLLDGMWGRNVYVEERTVDVHVLRLRKALTPFGMGKAVETVRGVGWLPQAIPDSPQPVQPAAA